MSIDALNDVRESARQHLEILKALRLRDADKASEVLKKHLEWSTDLLRIST
jgi:DNA-binding GntR family transcriptional regulator